MTTYKGKLLRDIGELAVDQKLLEAAKELTVVDCGCVRVVEGRDGRADKGQTVFKGLWCSRMRRGASGNPAAAVGWGRGFSGKETAQGAENSTGEADGKVTKISAMKYVM